MGSNSSSGGGMGQTVFEHIEVHYNRPLRHSANGNSMDRKDYPLAVNVSGRRIDTKPSRQLKRI